MEDQKVSSCWVRLFLSEGTPEDLRSLSRCCRQALISLVSDFCQIKDLGFVVSSTFLFFSSCRSCFGVGTPDSTSVVSVSFVDSKPLGGSVVS